MTNGASGSALGTQYDGFLFASVVDDANGPLSVLSALARLDVDPWQTAATLAGLPRSDAVQSLASLFARLPGGLADRDVIATRLIHFLPNQANHPAGARGASVAIGVDAHARLDKFWAIFVISMLVVLGAQALAQGHPSPPRGPVAQAPAQGDAPGPSRPASFGR